jgi:hypothetical protein
MQTNQYGLVFVQSSRLETREEGHVLLAIRGLVDEHLEVTVGGRYPGPCNASDRKHGFRFPI